MMPLNRAAAEIAIGGKLPAKVLEEFLDELDSTGAKVCKHDGEGAAFQNAEQLRQAVDESGHLVLLADQAQFKGLQDYCATHGIAFDLRGAAGNMFFRPGMTEPKPLDKHCEALLDTGNIRPIAKELAGLVTVNLSKEKVLAAAVKIIRHLNGLLPPELPPFEIEEQ